MAILPLSQVVSGMVLSKDVLDMSGRMLLGRTATISDKHIKIFKTWGVSEIHVEDMGSANQTPVNAINTPANTKLYTQAKEEALRLFPNASHPLNQLILTYATRTIYRRLERGGDLHGC